MRFRGLAALALALAPLGWLIMVRQRAVRLDANRAVLRQQINALSDERAVPLGAVELAASSTPDALEPLAVSVPSNAGNYETASAPPAQDLLAPLAGSKPQVLSPSGTRTPGWEAAVATGTRGECSSHPVVFWHYPKTGSYHAVVASTTNLAALSCLGHVGFLCQVAQLYANISSCGQKRRVHPCGRKRGATQSLVQATRSCSAHRALRFHLV